MCLFPHEQRISVGFEPTIFLIAFLSCIVLITMTLHYLEHAIYSGYSSMHFPAVIQGLRLHSKVLKWIGLYLKIISSNVNILTGLHERRGQTCYQELSLAEVFVCWLLLELYQSYVCLCRLCALFTFYCFTGLVI